MIKVETESVKPMSLQLQIFDFGYIEKNKKIFGEKISSLASIYIKDKSEESLYLLKEGLQKRIQAFEGFSKPQAFLDHNQKLGLNDAGTENLELMKEIFKKIWG